MGPAASQIAIKQLGTNGGGFFNVNSAHPFENPTPLSNCFQALSILLIPAACCYTFGALVKDKRQGWALLATMLIIFVPMLALTYYGESSAAFAKQPNLEGKELRFGIADSSIWAAATTAASNGSVNSMHDSYMPLGQLTTMFLMMLGEVVFGGAGSGLYGMVVFAIIAVFIAGLMVGRTPEYLGKKIESPEMKMASLAILAPPLCVLLGAAIAVSFPEGRGIQDRGAHGFSEILYAFTSMGNNNGSAFGGYTANTPLVNYTGAISMLISRFGVALPVLAIAGTLAQKKIVPQGPGTLATHNSLFITFLALTVLIVGALAFLPALALGPIAEMMQLHQ
jgi:K+-transporting ATPase ATPase A chain